MNTLSNERLLSAWLNMLIAVDTERLTGELPYNEALVCNVLKNNSDKEITATDLCNILKMQKSLMNRTLINLENKNLVQRVRSNIDKRNIIVKYVDEEDNLYDKCHKRIMTYIDRLINEYGEDKIDSLASVFENISNIANKKND